jgi:hypothetical protein
MNRASFLALTGIATFGLASSSAPAMAQAEEEDEENTLYTALVSIAKCESQQFTGVPTTLFQKNEIQTVIDFTIIPNSPSNNVAIDNLSGNTQWPTLYVPGQYAEISHTINDGIPNNVVKGNYVINIYSRSSTTHNLPNDVKCKMKIYAIAKHQGSASASIGPIVVSSTGIDTMLRSKAHVHSFGSSITSSQTAHKKSGTWELKLQ